MMLERVAVGLFIAAAVMALGLFVFAVVYILSFGIGFMSTDRELLRRVGAMLMSSPIAGGLLGVLLMSRPIRYLGTKRWVVCSGFLIGIATGASAAAFLGAAEGLALGALLAGPFLGTFAATFFRWPDAPLDRLYAGDDRGNA